jgi:hypothetical protein
MLLGNGNPYARAAPGVLALDWDDFRFGISSANRAALGRKAKWTVLAILAADCNLARWMFDDLLEMKSVGSSDDVHVIVVFDGPYLTDSFFARLNAGTPLADDLLMRSNELNTSDPKLLEQVLLLTQAFPSERQLLVVGGHGLGWRGMLVDENRGQRYFEPGRLRLPGPGAACDAELKRCQQAALAEINAAIGPDSRVAPIELMAIDACYMGNLESIATLSRQSRWLVVSEDQWPGEGFDYRALLGTLTRDPGIAPLALARAIVESSERFYKSAEERGSPVTLVALDGAAVPELAAAVVRFAQALDPRDAALHEMLDQALAATWRSQPTGLVDLKGLAQQVAARPVPVPCADAARALVATFDRTVVAFCGGGTPSSTNGLSIYAPPPDDFDVDYVRLANGLPDGLGVWAWALGGHYHKRLGATAPGHPLVAALYATMHEAVRRGDWRPGQT